MELRIFIIDDEKPARRELKFLLDHIEGAEVVGEAPNGALGLKGIKEQKPQIVFLDVQMPGLSGLDLSMLLSEMPDKPLLIFATAFQEYAVDAFDVEAFDYILKPFTLERVKKSVMKANRFLQGDMEHPSVKAAQVLKKQYLKKAEHALAKKIPLFRGERIMPIAPDRILCARSHDGEVQVRTPDGKYRAKSTLNELEQKLSAHGFIRTHRSFLVNVNHIMEIIPWFNGSFKLVMDDREKTEVPVSRQNVKDLKRYFDL